jgi:hypothetical protein
MSRKIEVLCQVHYRVRKFLLFLVVANKNVTFIVEHFAEKKSVVSIGFIYSNPESFYT